MALLEIVDIHTYYGDAYVLQGLSLALEEGQILGLLGRNGVRHNPPRHGSGTAGAAGLFDVERRRKSLGRRAQHRPPRLGVGPGLRPLSASRRTAPPARP